MDERCGVVRTPFHVWGACEVVCENDIVVFWDGFDDAVWAEMASCDGEALLGLKGGCVVVGSCFQMVL